MRDRLTTEDGDQGIGDCRTDNQEAHGEKSDAEPSIAGGEDAKV